MDKISASSQSWDYETPVFALRSGRGERHLTLCWSGILIGNWQFKPIVSGLPTGDVYSVATRDIDESVRVVRLAQLSGRYDQITLAGASLGGMMLPFIVRRFRELWPEDNLAWLDKIVVIDAPDGVKTMMELPNWAAPVMKFRPTGLVICWFIQQFALKPPRDQEIDVPFSREPVAWRTTIKHDIMATMKTSGTRLYQADIAWMIESGGRRLKRACRSLHGLDVVYVACMSVGNVTVAQPPAYQSWRAWAEVQEVYLVHAVHCGFAQQPDRFIRVLKQVFST